MRFFLSVERAIGALLLLFLSLSGMAQEKEEFWWFPEAGLKGGFEDSSALDGMVRDSAKGRGLAEKGQLVWISERGIDSLIRKYQRINKKRPLLEGYRVQIFSGSREKAEKVKTKFLEEYSEIPVHNNWNPPTFQIRIGNFRTRLQAERYRQKILGDFPNAYIVNTKIDLPQYGNPGTEKASPEK